MTLKKINPFEPLSKIDKYLPEVKYLAAAKL